MPYSTGRFIRVVLLFALFVAAPAGMAQDAANEKGPLYSDYKGVRLGMSVEEARKALGNPTDKSDKQDFYAFSDDESAQIFYNAEKKVYAVSVFYTGGKSIPSARSVLGVDPEAKPDGSLHSKIDYPKAGYWVAYSRTAGTSPLITVTMSANTMKGQ